MDEVKILYHYLQACNLNQPTMVDVGSHSGGALYKFAKANWIVYGFEPNPHMRKKSQKNLANWKIEKNVTIFDFALSNSNEDEVDFFLSNESTGISSLIPFHKSHESRFKVKMRTFESWEKENPINKIDFLKIDVEGNDMKVLQGFNWDKFDPTAVIVEYEDNKTKLLNIQMKDLFRFLKEKGYSIIISEWHPIEKYGIDHKWKQFILEDSTTTYNPNGWGNLIAVKNLNLELFANAIQNASLDDIQRLKKNAHDHEVALNKLRESTPSAFRDLYRAVKKRFKSP